MRGHELRKHCVAGSPEARGRSVLLLHDTPAEQSRDVAESVRAIRRGSRFAIYPVNRFWGYPTGLARLQFDAIVLHYTMFYAGFEPVDERIRALLARSQDAVKIAYFQDEQAFIAERVEFCRRQRVDVVYTCLEPPYASEVYGAVAGRVRTYLPGYVSPWLREIASRLARQLDERPIDIGYRGRRPPAEWGPAAREKYEIAVEFERRARSAGLILDIAADEASRIYGEAWPRFIASCKAVLGAESGATIDATPIGGPPALPYRTIGPRHFEAAALGTCQILFEGHYSGALEPMVHYIPLAKDFSNFDEVIDRFRDRAVRERLAARARADLIDSHRYDYSVLVTELDDALEAAGLTPGPVQPAIARSLYPPKLRRRGYQAYRAARALARRLRTRVPGRR